MGKKITESRNGIHTANEGMNNVGYMALNKIRDKLKYLTGNGYEWGKLVELSPNEMVEKIIEDLNALKGDDKFMQMNEGYLELRSEKKGLEESVAKTKSEIEKALGADGKKEIFSIPLRKLSLKYSLASWIADDIRWSKKRIVSPDDISLGDLVKFCIENEDREYAVKQFRNIGDGEVKKIKELFDRYGIEI